MIKNLSKFGPAVWFFFTFEQSVLSFSNSRKLFMRNFYIFVLFVLTGSGSALRKTAGSGSALRKTAGSGSSKKLMRIHSPGLNHQDHGGFMHLIGFVYIFMHRKQAYIYLFLYCAHMHHTCHKSAPALVRRRGGFQARNPPLRARIYHTPFYPINTKMPAVEKNTR